MERGLLDVVVQKLSSRKLLVFVVATVALFLGVVDPNTWMVLCCIYLGVEGVADIVGRAGASRVIRRVNSGVARLPIVEARLPIGPDTDDHSDEGEA